MFKRFKSKTRSVLGMDIGPTSINMLELSFQGETLCVETCGYKPLPPNVVEAGGIIDSDTLSLTIKTLLSEMNPTTRHVALAVPDSMIMSKTIQFVNNLTDLELEELAFHEAKKLLMFSSEAIFVDFVVLGDSEIVGMVNVLLVISKSEPILKRIEAIKSAGLEVILVDIESYAMARALNYINRSSFEKVIMVVDISYPFMRLCIVTNGRVIYTRDEKIDIAPLLETLTEQEKKFVAEQSFLSNQEIMSKSWRLFSDLALLHLKRNIQLFLANGHYGAIHLIYVAGEGIELNKLAQYVEAELNISTLVINLLNHADIPNTPKGEKFSLSSSFLVSFGLAIRQMPC